MREIKFRSWDGKQFIPVCINADGQACVIVYPGQQIIQDNCQQFTGLKDKNGKEIYEGDIVEQIGELSLVKTNREVKYKDTAGAFLLDGCLEFAHNLNLIEVIGNIFENKDLIK